MFVSKLIRLTEYETGNAVVLRPEFIMSMRDMKAGTVVLNTIPPVEYGQRTLINLADRREVKVTQSVGEILAMIEENGETTQC